MAAARVDLCWRIGLVAVAAGLGLAGCADLRRATGITPEPIDASSAVAEQVQEAQARTYPQPSFRDVPPKPSDIRAPAGIKVAVAENDRARDAFDAWLAANPPMQILDPAATTAYAATGRASLPASEMTPVPTLDSEAFAAQLRAFAAPPSQPK